MPEQVIAGEEDREEALRALSDTVAEAASFFAEIDGALFDGHQSAREVLSHLVFWHREYTAIIQALAAGQRPPLKKGTFAQLNAMATCEFADQSMGELVDRWLVTQEELATALRRLPDWEVSFSVKSGGRQRSASARVLVIESHVRGHLKRLQRADRLGEAWVRAYYSQS